MFTEEVFTGVGVSIVLILMGIFLWKKYKKRIVGWTLVGIGLLLCIFVIVVNYTNLKYKEAAELSAEAIMKDLTEYPNTERTEAYKDYLIDTWDLGSNSKYSNWGTMTDSDGSTPLDVEHLVDDYIIVMNRLLNYCIVPSEKLGNELYDFSVENTRISYHKSLSTEDFILKFDIYVPKEELINQIQKTYNLTYSAYDLDQQHRKLLYLAKFVNGFNNMTDEDKEFVFDKYSYYYEYPPMTISVVIPKEHSKFGKYTMSKDDYLDVMKQIEKSFPINKPIGTF